MAGMKIVLDWQCRQQNGWVQQQQKLGITFVGYHLDDQKQADESITISGCKNNNNNNTTNNKSFTK